MKKSYLIYLFGFLLGVSFISFASAAYFPDARSLSQSVIDAYVGVGEPILQALFGGYGGWSGFLLFERFLIFILLLAIIHVALGRVGFFEEKGAVRWIVAIVVPLIAMRFINYDQISAILTQYQLLAIVISSILPFVIFFFFVQGIGEGYPIMRKILWVFFIAVYLGLWTTTASEIQSTIFFWTVVAAFAVLIFDKRIEMYFAAKEFAKREEWNINNKIAEINDKIDKIHRQILNGTHPNAKEGKREINDLTLQKRYLQKHI